jgi:biopolymer transport protein ExbB/TolQ
MVAALTRVKVGVLSRRVDAPGKRETLKMPITWFVAPPLGSLLTAFWTSNLAGKGIVLVLFVGSIVVWSVGAAKLAEMREARRRSEAFLRKYRESGSVLSLLQDRRQFPGSPLFAVYQTVCLEMAGSLGRNDDAASGERPGRPSRGARGRSARAVAEAAVVDQTMELERYMGLLATATTAAPFLGLLGTVWGVLDSFESIAFTGSAVLSAVAPGISGALLTTVIGLIVALPSSIVYNILLERIRKLAVQMDQFAEELLADIERGYGVK